MMVSQALTLLFISLQQLIAFLILQAIIYNNIFLVGMSVVTLFAIISTLFPVEVNNHQANYCHQNNTAAEPEPEPSVNVESPSNEYLSDHYLKTRVFNLKKSPFDEDKLVPAIRKQKGDTLEKIFEKIDAIEALENNSHALNENQVRRRELAINKKPVDKTPKSMFTPLQKIKNTQS